MTTNVTLTTQNAVTTLVLTGGAPGQGVPVGGATGEALMKRSGTSFDTEWSDPSVRDSFTFNTGAGVTVTTGQMAWNSDEGTVDIGMNGSGAPVLQLGQELYYRVKNGTGATIANGTPVMATGTDGNSGRITIGLADASSSNDPMTIVGVATEDIPAGQVGYVTHFGKVRGLDTSAWPDGTKLWVSPTVPGGFVTTEPDWPNPAVLMAIVINQHANVGTIHVRPSVRLKGHTDRVAVPASATSAGTIGDWAADASYLYICVSVNTWRRTALTTW